MENEKMTIEDLAVMVKRGFDDLEERLGERIDAGRKDIESLKLGQERIEKRLDNVVYRTELDALDERASIVEKKVGVK